MPVEPVKLSRRTCGFSTSSSPIGAASPGAFVTMLSTPSGKPASAKISPQIRPPTIGDHSDGFKTTAVAEHERRGDRAGREDQRGVPGRDRADDADRPAQAHREGAGVGRDAPRRAARRRARRSGGTAPARSASGTCRSRTWTPVSRASSETTSSWRLSRMSAAFRKIPCRTAGGVCAQAGAAAAAASTARRASAREPAATSATRSPLNGSRSSNVRPPSAPAHSPPMKSRFAVLSRMSALICISLCSIRSVHHQNAVGSAASSEPDGAVPSAAIRTRGDFPAQCSIP